jgi:predicted dinucleotide-binding enzyme
MRIGIMGAGFIGRAVAQLGIAAGCEVMVSNSRGAETLREFTETVGCKAGSVEQAIGFGDAVLIAVPFKNVWSIPADALAGNVVLDANNYYPDRDGRIAELDARTTTTSEMLARHLPRARVVKALNAILASDLVPDARPAGTPQRRALPIAGNRAAAKAIAAELLDRLGYDVVDAGPLSEGWRFERAKPAYCISFDREGLRTALARAERDVELPHGSWRR